MSDTTAIDRQTSDPDRRFPVRRVSFDGGLADLDRDFATDGDVIMSHLLAALSGVFPDGEEMFVESVKHYRDQVTDPDLRQQVNAFIGQESVHGREHRELNDKLDALGYRAKHVERMLANDDAFPPYAQRFVGLLHKLGVLDENPFAGGEIDPPPMFKLALTAALEHYTSTMAEQLLTDRYLQSRFAHDGLFRLWAWHAIEESEHKSVAFDVYKGVGGDEQTRRRAMTFAGMALIFIVGSHTVFGVVRDPRSWSPGPGGLMASLRRLLRNPLFSKRFRRRVGDYHRADFHPLDHDSTWFEEPWKVWFEQGGERPILDPAT
jgi:predicted metal-dependent hydrolase